MKALLRDNGLTITLIAMFLVSVVGMILAGKAIYNQELSEHGVPAIGISAYLASGEFLSALFENWESEFLQMSAYVMLTAILYQRGSAESRDPDQPDRAHDELTAGDVQKHPFLSWLYSYSLGIALAGLFASTFLLHVLSSLSAANERASQHGTAVHSLVAYLLDPQLWFESFQNWQSEFLSTAALVVLSIVLRHKGSPESKPVGAGHGETGAEVDCEARIDR